MKRFNFNIKDRKVLTLGFCLVLVCVFTLTVAYSALSAVLTISGNAQVSSVDWDIYLADPKVKDGSVNSSVPTINRNTLSFTATLNMPGDFYEFTVDVVNDGDIDAMIESVTKSPELTSEQLKYLRYSVTYQNGKDINSKQLLSKNTTMPIRVRIEFRKDIQVNDLPTTGTILDLSLIINYVQSDGNGDSVINNGAGTMIYADGSIDEIGTIVTIGTEQFYVIGTEGDNVNLLSMYNLYVGGEWSTTERKWTPYGDEATGMQDPNMRGAMAGGEIYKGSTVFSSDTQKGINYNDYEGSIIEGYINNYVTLLENKFDVTINDSRLISKEEIVDTFGCDINTMVCSTIYPWVYSTSYWTGDIMDDVAICSVNTVGRYGAFLYSNNSPYGVRPVIVISKDLVIASEDSQIFEFSISTGFYQAERGMSWEEWVNSEYNTGGFTIDTVGNYIYILGDDGSSKCYVNDTDDILRLTSNLIIYPGNYKIKVQ